VLDREEIGWVSPPGEPHRLSEIVAEASSDPATIDAMALRARRAVENKYTYDLGIKTYCGIIESLYKK